MRGRTGRVHQHVQVTVARSSDFHPEVVVYDGVVTAEGESAQFGQWLTMNLGGDPERDMTISHLEQPNVVVEVLSREPSRLMRWVRGPGRWWKRLVARIKARRKH